MRLRLLKILRPSARAAEAEHYSRETARLKASSKMGRPFSQL
jgi:hypothetical protein